MFYGAGGDDIFYMDNAALDAFDCDRRRRRRRLAGLSGDYSAGITFANFTMKNIEDLAFDEGFDYDITLADGNVAAGETLDISGGYLTACDSLMSTVRPRPTATSTSMAPLATTSSKAAAATTMSTLSEGGVETDAMGGGDDTVQFWGTFTTADFVDGGDGDRPCLYSGNYAGGLTLGVASIQNVEGITFGETSTTTSPP